MLFWGKVAYDSPYIFQYNKAQLITQIPVTAMTPDVPETPVSLSLHLSSNSL